jgi:3-hydroxy acid dehydrogenase/malonic semialdehyde reductase
MKNILITGASSGIGKECAIQLNLPGHHLILIGRNEERLAELSHSLSSAEYHVCDVREYNEVKQLADHLSARGVEVDVLINNAGIGYFNPLAAGTIEEWQEMIDINIKGVVNVIHAFLNSLVKRYGHVINLGSLASHQVFPNSGIYCATKHAVLAISESLRIEFAGKLRVTTISPGSVNTPFILQTKSEEMLNQYRDYFASGLPASLVAEQIVHAIMAPQTSVISEIIIRPSRPVV